MDKGASHSLFVNDGLFMERFKQMPGQQEKGASLVPKPIAAALSSAACDVCKNTAAKSGSKLAFSFKQKSACATLSEVG